MTAVGLHLFDTPLGACAIGWSDCGVVGVQLPEPEGAQTLAVLRRRFPGGQEAEASPEARKAIDGITALLSGAPVDLASVVLDLRQTPEFDRRVYAAAQAIPPGETLTYGEVAAAIGEKALARAVGQALGRNPFPIVVPCHRVLAAGGRLGGFSARGGTATKLRLLAIESAGRTGALDLFGGLPMAAAPSSGGRRPAARSGGAG